MIRKFITTIGLAALLMVAVPLTVVSSVGAATFGDASDSPLNPNDDNCTSILLLFPTWYRGLERKDGSCELVMPAKAKDGVNVQTFMFTIILNVIDILLRVVGYAAVGFIIYGGFKYLTSAGSADRITAGRKIIQNALIGLVISFLSVAIVNLIANSIKQ